MDYVVARMQAAGHTHHTYNAAAAVPPVPHQPQAAHQLHSIGDHRPPPVVSPSPSRLYYAVYLFICSNYLL